MGFGRETAGLELHRHEGITLVWRHLHQNVVEIERVLEDHQVHAKLRQLTVAELAVA